MRRDRTDMILLVLLVGLIQPGRVTSFGLTTYGEQCLDACSQRGFPFAWCHKQKSHNGTFIDRDYCSPVYGTTRYLETCTDSCERRDGKPFYWCHTYTTSRGDWDYCSPFLDDFCSWGTWSSWGHCSTTCGAGTMARRRRVEGSDGRVGKCSGETEVMYQGCQDKECSGSSTDTCEWSEWSSWSLCSISCGEGGERKRYRVVSRKEKDGGACSGDSTEVQPCPLYSCPPFRARDTTLSPVLDGRLYLGDLNDGSSAASTVSGQLYLKVPGVLNLENFIYKGDSKVVFWIGSSDLPEGEIIIPVNQGESGIQGGGPSRDFTLILPNNRQESDWLAVKTEETGETLAYLTITQDSEENEIVNVDPVTIPPSVLEDFQVMTAVPNIESVEREEMEEKEEDMAKDRVITIDIPNLAEQPRSIGKGFGFQNNFFPEERGEKKEKTKEEKRKENDIKRIKAELDENVDFTVVRVMSSMSSNMDSTKPPPMTTEASLTEATTSITSTDGKMLEDETTVVNGFIMDKTRQGNIEDISTPQTDTPEQITTMKSVTVDDMFENTFTHVPLVEVPLDNLEPIHLGFNHSLATSWTDSSSTPAVSTAATATTFTAIGTVLAEDATHLPILISSETANEDSLTSEEITLKVETEKSEELADEEESEAPSDPEDESTEPGDDTESEQPEELNVSEKSEELEAERNSEVEVEEEKVKEDLESENGGVENENEQDKNENEQEKNENEQDKNENEQEKNENEQDKNENEQEENENEQDENENDKRLNLFKPSRNRISLFNRNKNKLDEDEQDEQEEVNIRKFPFRPRLNLTRKNPSSTINDVRSTTPRIPRFTVPTRLPFSSTLSPPLEDEDNTPETGFTTPSSPRDHVSSLRERFKDRSSAFRDRFSERKTQSDRNENSEAEQEEKSEQEEKAEQEEKVEQEEKADHEEVKEEEEQSTDDPLTLLSSSTPSSTLSSTPSSRPFSFPSRSSLFSSSFSLEDIEVTTSVPRDISSGPLIPGTTRSSELTSVAADPSEIRLGINDPSELGPGAEELGSTIPPREPPQRTTPTPEDLGVSNFQLLLSALTTEPTPRDTTISRVSFENIPRDTSISSIETNPSATSISSTEQISSDITTPTVSINSADTESDTTDVSILPSDEEATISPDDISQDINTENDINPTAKRKSLFNLRKRPNFRPRRPELGRGQTVENTATTPIIRNLKDLFNRRRSTTTKPVEDDTTEFVPSSEDGSTPGPVILPQDKEPRGLINSFARNRVRVSTLRSPVENLVEEPRSVGVEDKEENPGTKNRIFNTDKQFPNRIRPARPFQRRLNFETTTESVEPEEITSPTFFSTSTPLPGPFTTPITTEGHSVGISHQVTRRPFIRSTIEPFFTTPSVIDTTPMRMSDDERFKIMSDFMMESMDKTKQKPSSGPDPVDGSDEKFNLIQTDTTTLWESDKIEVTTNSPPASTDPTVTIRFDDIEDYDEQNAIIDNVDSNYNPCDLRGTCGPNAKCSVVASNAVCSCPPGFSGIPRNGLPDPQHGCVRTPLSCAGNETCPAQFSCEREACLKGCTGDTECALGERCIASKENVFNKVCIKICFYDAHCLAGEYCEENVCRPGCKSDSNCPFGQICGAGECLAGCNFNNDCPLEQECRSGMCVDPCAGFKECGTNAVCSSIHHLPVCTCPPGFKELNSPYDACVEESIDLTQLECLTDSDCASGACFRGSCRSP